MGVSAVPEPAAGSVNPVAILASAARNASGSGAAVVLGGTFQWLVLELVVSGVTGGNFNVWLQQSWDGVNWDDVGAVIGIAATAVYSMEFPVRARDAQAAQHTWTDAGTPGTGVYDHVMGRRYRAVWTVGAPGTFTFQVLAHLR